MQLRTSRPAGGTRGTAAPVLPRRRAPRPLSRWEYGLVLSLCLSVLALHDVSYLLRQPYWTDEAWVALTTRFPLARLPSAASSTPIGWAFLLRLVTFGQGQSGRLLPLGFAALAVVPAYLLARRLDWDDSGTAVAAGSLAAVAVLLVPAMLIRDDLKQYTADACLTLVILAATARLERQWSRRGLALLSVAAWGGMLLSDAAAFAGAAALGGICLVQLARKRWGRLAEAAVTSAATAALGAAVYEAFDARAFVPGLAAYWRSYYIPVHDGLGASASFAVGRFEYIHGRLGLGPAWLAFVLVLIGLVAVARLGRPATAVAAGGLWLEMIILAAAGKYPFLDVRTSTFLTTASVVIAAIGVAGCCSLVRTWPTARLRSGRLGAAARGTATWAGALLAAAALAAFVLQAVPFARGQPIPPVSTRQQARYLAARSGRDPVVVGATSTWGLAYYWPDARLAIAASTANLQGYTPVFAAQRRIVMMRGRTAGAIRAAMTSALAVIGAGGCGRVWLVRTRIRPAEAATWQAVLASMHLSATGARYGLAFVQAGPASCRAGGQQRAR